MNYTDYILNMSESTDIALLPKETQEFISTLSPEWPSFPMINTVAVDGRKLIAIRMAVQLTKPQLGDLFTAFGLAWQVVGIRSAERVGEDYLIIHPIDKANFIPFWQDIQDGETTRQATLADTIYLSTYAGTDPIEL
jgi:hypothetical protein